MCGMCPFLPACLTVGCLPHTPCTHTYPSHACRLPCLAVACLSTHTHRCHLPLGTPAMHFDHSCSRKGGGNSPSLPAGTHTEQAFWNIASLTTSGREECDPDPHRLEQVGIQASPPTTCHLHTTDTCWEWIVHSLSLGGAIPTTYRSYHHHLPATGPVIHTYPLIGSRGSGRKEGRKDPQDKNRHLPDPDFEHSFDFTYTYHHCLPLPASAHASLSLPHYSVSLMEGGGRGGRKEGRMMSLVPGSVPTGTFGGDCSRLPALPACQGGLVPTYTQTHHLEPAWNR